MSGAPRAGEPQLCLLGAAIDTGNLGVTALCYGTLNGIALAATRIQVTVFDEGEGLRDDLFETAEHRLLFQRCGAWYSKRVYRRESLFNIRASARLGGLGNPGARALLDADAVLDISGGDSFTDMYGPKRFNSVTLTKRIALENRIPLILLPQTYGPFANPRNRRTAERIVREARMAWARDPHSFEHLRELAGADFDPERHCEGVDVAFGMEEMQPPAPLPEPIPTWLHTRPAPIVGINISGLIYNRPEAAARQYSLRADYRAVVIGLLRRLLAESDCLILLVPHVVTPPGHFESDIEACDAVAKACDPSVRRVQVLPAMTDPRHVKWVIARLDWFCGTRMHSTIAGLSSGVPTAAIAYSDKTLGVFASCRQAKHVHDPRHSDTTSLVSDVLGSYLDRERAALALRDSLAGVACQVRRQMEFILTSAERAAT